MTVEAIEYERPALWDVIERGGKPYHPLFWQAKHIHSRTERFIIAACGRRSGKTSAMKGEIAREIVKPPSVRLGVEHPPLIYVVGPTAEASMKVWKPVWELFVPPDSANSNYQPPLGFMHEDHDKNRRFIQLVNGVEIYGKTADDTIGLQGDPVSLAIVDESQDVRPEAWGVLVPGLSDSRGRLFAIGIPRGKTPFRSYWNLGQGEDLHRSLHPPRLLARAAAAHPRLRAASIPTQMAGVWVSRGARRQGGAGPTASRGRMAPLDG